MGRLSTIEDIAAGTIPYYSNLKMLVRGRPRYLDSQLDGGLLRFATKRGFNCTAVLSNNQVPLTEDAFRDSTRLVMTSRPLEMGIQTLVRIGESDAIGEMHIVADLIDSNAIDIRDPLVRSYSADQSQNRPPVVTLLGTPCSIYAAMGSAELKRSFFCESWYRLVPGDVLLLSPSPDILASLVEYEIAEVLYQDDREGNTSIGEPETLFRYKIRLKTKTGLLPFVPAVGFRLYLKAQPLYFRDNFGISDIELPSTVGPFLLDAFFGGMLISNKNETKIGLRTWEPFGSQLNLADTGGEQEWQLIEPNHLILERPITSDSFLFWQRVTGNFQFQKQGFFVAEMDTEGRFTMTSDLLVPNWPADKERGWVIPIFARSETTCVVQFEPQPPQVFDIPSNSLTFIRPKIFTEQKRTLLTFTSPFVREECRLLTIGGRFVEGDSISFRINGTRIGPIYFRDSHQDTLNDLLEEITSKSTTTRVRILSHTVDDITLAGPADTLNITALDYENGNPTVVELPDFIPYFSFNLNGVPIGPINAQPTLELGIQAIIRAVNIKKLETRVTAERYDDGTIVFIGASGTVDIAITERESNNDVVKTTVFPIPIFNNPIRRVVVSFSGSPGTRVEMRDWQFDGPVVTSLSYFLLGTGQVFGENKWMAGGLCIKPLFFDINVLKARYSDGQAHYNAGYLYT